jgi:hypothetical protein
VPDQKPRKISRAAFARADVDDAKRGYPDVDLQGYAADRGLEYLNSALPSGFVGVMPQYPDYVYNCMRGSFDREFGVLAHELYEIEADSDGVDMNGQFYAVRSVTRGSFFGLWERGRPSEPFAANAVWVPSTRVSLRLPEVALLPSLTLLPAERLPRLGSRKLDTLGAGGWRLVAGEEYDERAVTHFVAGAAPILHSLGYAFAELRIDGGNLSLVRNGYAKTPQELDRLVGEACALAGVLRDACAPLWTPQPFDDPLPPPPWLDPTYKFPDKLAVLGEHWRDGFRRAAEEQGMTLEDPGSFHRAFPTQPVPGVAQGVLRGSPFGASATFRVAWFADRAHVMNERVRGAALFSARRSAQQTPRGGMLVADTGMLVEVRDGIVGCWRQKRTRGSLESRELIPQALDIVRELKLADV